MSLAKFARLNQVMERQTPNKNIERLVYDWHGFSDKEILMQLLTLDYPVSNIAEKKAMKWIAKALEVFDEEIEQAKYIHDDLGTAIYHFVEEQEDSKITLKQFYDLISADCSKIDSSNFLEIRRNFLDMSPLEKKWFIRYWLRNPRNGVGLANINKFISVKYDKTIEQVESGLELNSPARLIKFYERGEIPDGKLKPHSFIRPMLSKVISPEEWPLERTLEYKYNGGRYQIHKDNGVSIFNRRGKLVTSKFPEIVEMVEGWEGSFIIDTEVYPSKGGKPLPLQNLSVRIHSVNVEAAREECPVEIVVFDCLMYGDEILYRRTLKERMPFIMRFPKQVCRANSDSEAFYNRAIAEGYEGIMVKDLNQSYEPGKRSWIKYKPPKIELDVVITGARYGEGKRSHMFASYDIAVKDVFNFIPVGSVGSGFSEKEMLLLTQRLKPIISKFEGRTFNILPRIVIEVQADKVNKNASGGISLKSPRYIRMRDDKPVSDISTIEDIMEKIE